MTPLFADAWYFIALVNPRDQYHVRAKDFDLRNRSIVTTQLVLTEVGDALSNHNSRHLFLKIVGQLDAWPDSKVISGSNELYLSAVDLYRRRPDKDWSLTDCTSFVVMEREGLKEAITADHHFVQAGFVALLS